MEEARKPRITEAQLRWAQFHYKEKAKQVKSSVEQLYQYPSNVSDVDGARSDDGQSSVASSIVQTRKFPVSRGRRALLRVSQRHYEERKRWVQEHGFRDEQIIDEDDEEAQSETDELAAIFAEDHYRKRRKSRKHLQGGQDDAERVNRFEQAFRAMMLNIAAVEAKQQEEENVATPTKIWSRPDHVPLMDTVDGKHYLDLKWGVMSKENTRRSYSNSILPMLDRGASWLTHLPKKDKKSRRDEALRPDESHDANYDDQEVDPEEMQKEFSDIMSLLQQQVAGKGLEPGNRYDGTPTVRLSKYFDQNQDDIAVDLDRVFAQTDAKMTPEDFVESVVQSMDRKLIQGLDEKEEGGARDILRRCLAEAGFDPKLDDVRSILPYLEVFVRRYLAGVSKETAVGMVQRLVSHLEQHPDALIVSKDGKLEEKTFKDLINQYFVVAGHSNASKVKITSPSITKVHLAAIDESDVPKPKIDQNVHHISQSEIVSRFIQSMRNERVDVDRNGKVDLTSLEIMLTKHLSRAAGVASAQVHSVTNMESLLSSKKSLSRVFDQDYALPLVDRLVARFEKATVDVGREIESTILAELENSPVTRYIMAFESKHQQKTRLSLVQGVVSKLESNLKHSINALGKRARLSSSKLREMVVNSLVEVSGSSAYFVETVHEFEEIVSTANDGPRISASFVKELVHQLEASSHLDPIMDEAGVLNIQRFENIVQRHVSNAMATKTDQSFDELRSPVAMARAIQRAKQMDRAKSLGHHVSRADDTVDTLSITPLLVKDFVTMMETQSRLENFRRADGKLDRDRFTTVVMQQLELASKQVSKGLWFGLDAPYYPPSPRKFVQKMISEFQSFMESTDISSEDPIDSVILCEATKKCIDATDPIPPTLSVQNKEAEMANRSRFARELCLLYEKDSSKESILRPDGTLHEPLFEALICRYMENVRTVHTNFISNAAKIGCDDKHPVPTEARKLTQEYNVGPNHMGLHVAIAVGVDHEGAINAYSSAHTTGKSEAARETQKDEAFVAELDEATAKSVATDDELKALAAYHKKREHHDDSSSFSSFPSLPNRVKEIVRTSLGNSIQSLPKTPDKSEYSHPSTSNISFDRSAVDGKSITENPATEFVTYDLERERMAYEDYEHIHTPLIDTDRSDTRRHGMNPELLASLMLSPTIITRRHQQALKSIESYNWEQTLYLISANPWLAEMADIHTSQYLLHKLALHGTGVVNMDKNTGKVLSTIHDPAPDRLQHELISRFPPSVHKFDRDGNLPLHMASISLNFSMITVLGDRFPGGASVRNEDGMLPLHLAVLACSMRPPTPESIDVVDAVLGYFPAGVAITDNEGNLPIHLAASVLTGDFGAAVVAMLLDEADRQLSLPTGARFRNKIVIHDVDNADLATDATAIVAGTFDEDALVCNHVINDVGETPLIAAIHAKAGWEVIDAIVEGAGGSEAVLKPDEQLNNALHLVVSDRFKDAAAALSLLKVAPEAVTDRNEDNMLPIELATMQRLPDEVILALVLADLPVSSDNRSVKHHGDSWWFLTCDSDDSYVHVVEQVIAICSYPQIRELCFAELDNRGPVIAHATHLTRDILRRALRFIGRFEFLGGSAVQDELGVKIFDAMDYGPEASPFDQGRRVVLRCYARQEVFEHDTCVLRTLEMNPSLFEEVTTFAVGKDGEVSPNNGPQQYCASIEVPILTLEQVVQGMLGNSDCQENSAMRTRYSLKVLVVLRSVAKAIRYLHRMGCVHSNIKLNCVGKFDDKWKLRDLVHLCRIGTEFNPHYMDLPPPELIECHEKVAVFAKTCLASAEMDAWGFGALAYHALVGAPIVDTTGTETTQSSLFTILQWNDHSVQDARQKLVRAHVPETASDLICHCLSPLPQDRPLANEILGHPVWKQLRHAQDDMSMK